MGNYLVVDDNLASAENLAEIIADGGDEAVVAGSGARALELVASRHFDALVSDMRMPLMSGAEMVLRTRQIDPGLPAIIMTAYTADGELDDARHLGLLDILAKPVPISYLLELLRSARRYGLVAIVEHDSAVALGLSVVLRQHGFASVMASTIDEIESLRELPLFAAIVEPSIPGGPSGETVRRLHVHFPALPVIAATGEASLTLPFGAASRSGKPFDPSAIVDRLEGLHARHPRA